MVDKICQPECGIELRLVGSRVLELEPNKAAVVSGALKHASAEEKAVLKSVLVNEPIRKAGRLVGAITDVSNASEWKCFFGRQVP